MNTFDGSCFWCDNKAVVKWQYLDAPINEMYHYSCFSHTMKWLRLVDLNTMEDV